MRLYRTMRAFLLPRENARTPRTMLREMRADAEIAELMLLMLMLVLLLLMCPFDSRVGSSRSSETFLFFL